MNLKRVLAIGVGGGAVAVWIASAATFVSPPEASLAPMTARAVETSGAQLAAEIAKLHERLRPTAVPLQTRDLFRYAARSATSSAVRVPAPAVVAIERPAPAVVALKLIGIAEDSAAGNQIRTAIIAGFNDVFLVKEGETIATRYRVARVSSSAVELIDGTDESTLRLSLP
jgi:hypothetical protein